MEATLLVFMLAALWLCGASYGVSKTQEADRFYLAVSAIVFGAIMFAYP